jgi:hypothetical protein
MFDRLLIMEVLFLNHSELLSVFRESIFMNSNFLFILFNSVLKAFIVLLIDVASVLLFCI